MAGYPPYAPYESEMEPPPPSVMEMIATGHGIRVQHKSKGRKSVHPPPAPARPKGPKATDVDFEGEAMCRHARCLRKHNAVLTDRLARMAKPDRRLVISKWREYANTLPPQAINRFRNFLDADEPFKPDQAYQFFINLRKGKKANKATKCKRIQKELRAMCGDRRYVWARKATVSFAKGIQQRLSKPGAYDLEDEVLRLSDVILNELCCYMRIHRPSRRSRNNKSKFVIEMADKVAVWIEEILAESENRMLMMDFDEDDDVLGHYDGYADDFLDMMGGGKRGAGGPAYSSFRGPKRKAFEVLTEAMNKKGDQPLVQHEKFQQSYKDAVRELKRAKSFTASDYNSRVANQLKKDLHDTVKSTTPSELQPAMNEVIDICADYLAQVAEHNKDKGAAFKHLVQALKGNPNEKLARKGNVVKTNGEAARMLEQAKSLETDHDDPNLSQEVHSKLKTLVEATTPSNLKTEMADSINAASKYISQAITDEAERGPAFDHMIRELEKRPSDPFTPQYKAVPTNHDAAHVLKTAPNLSSSHPNPETSKDIKDALHQAVDKSTPKNMQPDMKDVIDRSGDYISEFIDDREKVKDLLVNKLKSQPGGELANRNGYSMKYGDAATELESTPTIVPIMPIKDITDEIKAKLTKEMEKVTPPNLAKAMSTLINDAADHLSQIVALKSGAAGPNYNSMFLKAVKDKQGNKGLDKYKDNKVHTYPDDGEDGTETEQERLRRLAAEKILGRPETPEEKARRIAAEKRLGRPETPQEMKARMAAEKALGRPETDEERQDRLQAEKLLGRPETEEEMKQRRAEADLKKHGSETEEQRQAKHMAMLGKPESGDESKRRLEAEQRLSRSETSEEMNKRLAEEHAAGLSAGPVTEDKSRRLSTDKTVSIPETSQERARRIETEKVLGRPETAEEMKSRIATEKVLGRAETDEERQGRQEAEKRLVHPETEAEKRKTEADLKNYGLDSEQQHKAKHMAEEMLGKPESEDERKRRLEAGQRLGRPETAEEMRERLAEERAAGVGPETEDEKSRRIAAETILGRPETPEERRRRMETEKRLGRPETAEERQERRMEVEKRLGRPETEHEVRKRTAEADSKKYGPETEQQRQAIQMTEQVLGRSETSEERQRRLDTEQRLGRPETSEEMNKRLTEDLAAGIGGAGHESEEDKKRRLATEKNLGRPDPYEERQKRLSVEKRLGRPETEEEIKRRIVAKDEERKLKAFGGALDLTAETEAERKRRLEVEKMLGRPETDDERFRRLAAERRLGKPETAEERRQRLEVEEGQLRADERLGITPQMRRKMDQETWEKAHDPERESAMRILNRELLAKGEEKLYAQPQSGMVLTHKDASDWLKKGPVYVEKTVKISADTARLAEKLERKLDNLVSKSTPDYMKDVMQDVIIESARKLAEYSVAKTYKKLVEGALIGQMQKKGNDILVGVGGAGETCFFAAQRLKLPKPAGPAEPRSDVAYKIGKRLDNIAKFCPISRIMVPVMKDFVKNVSEYLSDQVTKPNPQIEAYIRLLEEMDAAGDGVLVDGPIKKTYKEAADYLRQLTSFEDKIKLSDSNLLSDIENKLNNLTKDVVSDEFPPAVMKHVVSENAKLLASYIALLGKKTAALQLLVENMEQEGDMVLLRHGIVRKTFKDGADMLRDITADQLLVIDPEPVACRKIQIKLENLMIGKTPAIHAPYMDDVIDDATKYLAVALLSPQRVKVCKCRKNVFVQCELWCEEILRRLSKPCCVCSRVVSAAELDDLTGSGSSSAIVPGVDIVVGPCSHMTPSCRNTATATYMLYETERDNSPTRLPRSDEFEPPFSGLTPTVNRMDNDSVQTTSSSSYYTPDTSSSYKSLASDVPIYTACANTANDEGLRSRPNSGRANVSRNEEMIISETSDSKVLKTGSLSKTTESNISFSNRAIRESQPSTSNQNIVKENVKSTISDTSDSNTRTTSISKSVRPVKIDQINSYRKARERVRTKPKITAHQRYLKNRKGVELNETSDSNTYTTQIIETIVSTEMDVASQTTKNIGESELNSMLTTQECICPHPPPITTEDMPDWHALLISLMWNVQAWRGWLQDKINLGLNYDHTSVICEADKSEHKSKDDDWARFQRRVMSEAVQWREYNIFSRQLTLRLLIRYRDKEILSPGRATNKTNLYHECQREMLDVVRMFNKWTQWLMSVVKEADEAKLAAFSTYSEPHICWNHYKQKVKANLADWEKYTMHLKLAWEQKYCMIISEWLPSWKTPGPVWVVSACGAVPIGAVPAGMHNNEVIWIARTTHKSDVYPAAVWPSKHSCLVYAEGTTYYYAKYQVMCNATVKWVPARSDLMNARVVRVAPGVHVGRVQYRGAHLVGAVRAPAHRCHVVILGRAFAFNCYDLLVLADNNDAAFVSDNTAL